MRLAYVTDFDPTDVDLQSGVAVHMTRALESQGIDVSRVFVRASTRMRANSAMKKLVYRRSGETYIGSFSPARLASNARRVERALARQPHDAVLGMHPSPLAHLDCGQPVVLWADTLTGGMIGFYPQASSLSKETIRDALAADQACLDRCTLAIFCSEWAARTALQRYTVDAVKVRMVPRGANFESGLDEGQIWELVRARSNQICELSFLGTDWRRKGGRFAVEVTSELRRLGIPARLTVVGPPASVLPDAPEYVRFVGFASQGDGGARQVLADLLGRSHFLLLPTTAECWGIALAEANSFGVPSLATDVGGIPSVIADGVNGRLFSTAEPAAAWADYIAGLFGNRPLYERLAMDAFGEYRARLNWAASAAKVKELLEQLPQRERS